MGRKLIENAVVAHASDGESVVDVASHAAEEKRETGSKAFHKAQPNKATSEQGHPHSTSEAVALALAQGP